MAKLRFILSHIMPSFLSKDSTASSSKSNSQTSSSNPNSQPNSSNLLSPFSVPVVSSSHPCCPRRLRRRRGFPRQRLTFSSGDQREALMTWPVGSSENSLSSFSLPRRKIDARLLRRKNRQQRSISSGEDSGWFSSNEDNYSKPHEEETESCFAVPKVSNDPRADFRRSMAEMVVERGIYNVAGLEKLLECFLALNEPRHRAAIVAAFEDVWCGVFPQVALAATFPDFSYKC